MVQNDQKNEKNRSGSKISQKNLSVEGQPGIVYELLRDIFEPKESKTGRKMFEKWSKMVQSKKQRLSGCVNARAREHNRTGPQSAKLRDGVWE